MSRTMTKAMAMVVVVAFASAASVTLTSAGPKGTAKPLPGLEGRLSDVHDRNCGKASMFCIESPRSTKKALPGLERRSTTQKPLPGVEPPSDGGNGGLTPWDPVYQLIRLFLGLR